MLAELVDELGGLDALAPSPGAAEAEPFSKLDFARRHVLEADAARPLGRRCLAPTTATWPSSCRAC